MPYKPNDEDKTLWAHVTKGIKRLVSNHENEPKTGHVPSPKEHKNIDGAGGMPKLPIRQSEPAQLDRRTESRLKRGKIEIEGTIDLHGLTKETAHINLTRFIEQSYQKQKRCVLVITGKGKISAPGVLKQNVPIWLSEMPLSNIVLKYVDAQPQDGGSGALYVYLKKYKS